MRVMEGDGLAREAGGGVAEERAEVEAVRGGSGEGDLGGGAEGGEEVGEDDGFGADGVGGGEAGPVNDEGDAEASFIE